MAFLWFYNSPVLHLYCLTHVFANHKQNVNTLIVKNSQDIRSIKCGFFYICQINLYSKLLEDVIIKSEEGIPLIPEMYAVPNDRVSLISFGKLLLFDILFVSSAVCKITLSQHSKIEKAMTHIDIQSVNR